MFISMQRTDAWSNFTSAQLVDYFAQDGPLDVVTKRDFGVLTVLSLDIPRMNLDHICLSGYIHLQ